MYDEDQLNAAFAEYLEAQETGNPQDRDEFLADFPELADTLAAHEGFCGMTDALCETLSPLSPGTVIGDYTIEERIGRGGMGTVYRARQMERIVVALKVCPFQATEEQRRQFLEEIEHLAALKSSHIVSVIGGGEHDGRLYFTMDLMEGGDLTQATAEGPIPPREAADLVAKIARGVHHAHQRQILHRDLKPHNVLLDAEGQPRVADFGLSIRSDKLRSTTEVVGAPVFMSPEQSRGEATVLSDVYGLGTVLYWLLTCQAPFEGESLQETLDKVRNEQPKSPHRINPQLKIWRDRYLESICLKCLQKKPEQRYGSAETLADDLERWLRDEPPLDVVIRKRDRLRFWCTRNPLIAGLTVTVLATLFLVMMAASVVFQSQDFALRKTMEDIRNHRNAVTDAKQKVKERLRKHVEYPEGKLQKSLKAGDVPSLRQFCVDAKKRIPHRNLVATIFIVGEKKKKILADSKPKGEGHPVAARKYVNRGFDNDFKDELFVSEVYQAKSDELWKYAIVARIRNEDGKILGLLAASIAPESSRAYQRQEKLVRIIKLWTGIALAPLAILLVATVWFAVRRVRSETNE